MEICFITENESKFKEAQEITKKSDITLIKKDLKLAETRTLDQEKVVLEKARAAFKIIKKPLITDDTGIYFEEYKKFPGTYTKFLFEAIGFKGLHRLIDGGNKNAYFKTLICYKDKKTEKIFSGVWKGKIFLNKSKKFNPDWQYNSIFVPQGYNKFLAEISLEERAKKSHRRKAFNNLIKGLKGGMKK